MFNGEHLKKRTPVIIKRINSDFYFKLQIFILDDTGHYSEMYNEYKKISGNNNEEIGKTALDLLGRFRELGDLTFADFEKIFGMSCYDHFKTVTLNNDALIGFSDDDGDECSIGYNIPENKYSFSLSWIYKSGGRRYFDGSDSLGKHGIMTFDEPLEFTEIPSPEELGKMIGEALDRSRILGDKMSGNYKAPKTIKLISGAELTVEAPHDNKFTDVGDLGIGELYLAYAYIPKWDVEINDAPAVFYIGMCTEFGCVKAIEKDTILEAWENPNGKADFFELSPADNGIFTYRAEMRNKKIQRISYIAELDKDMIDCTMEIYNPNAGKKLDKKLVPVFEDFARRCSYQLK